MSILLTLIIGFVIGFVIGFFCLILYRTIYRKRQRRATYGFAFEADKITKGDEKILKRSRSDHSVEDFVSSDSKMP